MKRKIYLHYILLAAMAILLTFGATLIVYFQLFRDEVKDNLKTYADLICSMEDNTDYKNFEYKPSNEKTRITIINKSGKVRSDTDADSSKMENHLNRKEIKDAIRDGEGESMRHSKTLNQNTFYYAVKLKNGDILRVSEETSSIWNIFFKAVPIVILIIIALFVVCMILAHFLTKGLVKPIEEMASVLGKRENFTVYKELQPFVDMIQKQHKEVMDNAQMRQEFTANVSHELKTPLTSISGYSELILNGMATNDDIIRFTGEIYQNSKRLLTLINDIIRLSELDVEDVKVSYEKVNISQIAETCVNMLEVNARKHDVKIEYDGETREIIANKQMVEELLYNLCDNAIRYNNSGGKVVVNVRKGENDNITVLSVKDNGIGISKEDQERIFERFYRVDKSRSKSTGGTGLGLAIVKHIVSQNKAKLEIESELNKGTEIRVIFNNLELQDYI